MAIPTADIVEQLIFGGKLPRSAEFVWMLENINRVEETPATRQRRVNIVYVSGGIFRPARLPLFGECTSDYVIPFDQARRLGIK